jgi:general secretion pathway protein I
MKAGGKQRRESGFSLLEMLVAVVILSLALGALYQSVAGATRNVRADQRFAYAVELARSLIADNNIVPPQGVSKSGVTAGGFSWSAESQALARPRGSPLTDAGLHELRIVVAWPDGTRQRRVALSTVVPGRG